MAKEPKIPQTLSPCSKCHIWHCSACGCAGDGHLALPTGGQLLTARLPVPCSPQSRVQQARTIHKLVTRGPDGA
jgi:hypothetical protein